MKLLTKRQKKQLITAVIVLLLAVLGAAQSDLLEKGVDTARQSQPGLYEVEEISDGDTIIVNMNGTREIIRLIGVDTPETHHPDRPLECYAQQAAEFSRKLLTGKKVRLEADPLNTNRDRYDRLLRYVYTDNNQLVEKTLISEGYGFSYTQFPFTKAAEFDAYEDQAKSAKKGLWGACQVTVEEGGLEKTNPAVP